MIRTGVVPALAFAADRQGDLAVAGHLGEGSRGVLAAPVGVEDHSRIRVARGDRVGQCVSNQLGAQVISDGKAHDAA